MKMLLSVLRETIVGPWNGEYQGFFLPGGRRELKKKKTFYMKIRPLRKESVTEDLGNYKFIMGL